MSNLSIFEKMKFEELFNMETGYVLDFSNASFKRFFANTVGIDIEQEKYNYGSNSKANRLRAYWDSESNILVGDLLSKLLEYWKTKKISNQQEISKGEQLLFDECTVVAQRLSNKDSKAKPITVSEDLDDVRISISGEGNTIGKNNIITNFYHLYPPQPYEVKEKLTKKIFISYRRDDSADISGRIYDRLAHHFEKGFVFKDVDSIPFGLDFRDVLGNALKECDVFLAIIGKEWLNLKNANGVRRIDDPEDFVKMEIESALQRKIPVIPVLVQGTSMPAAHILPQGIKELAYRNGIQVRPDPDFHKDMDRLISKL